jgi:4-methoxybenzoate monooxygenase (O-demethylating)
MIPSLSINPFDDAFLGDPYAYHDVLRNAGPVVWLEAIGCYGMARYAEVQAALKNWEVFVSSRGVGLSDFATEAPWRPPSLLLEADPPLHDRTRGLMNKVASLVLLKAAMPNWRAKAETMVESLVAQRRFDAVTDFGEAFPLSVFLDLVGLPDAGREHLLPYARTAFNAYGPRNALLAESLASAADATAWVASVCKRDQLKPGGWGAAVFAAVDRGECTEAEAERLVRSLLTAGVDTTVNGIGNIIHAFALHPEQWTQLRAEPSLTRRAFEESLRWDSTVQTFFRTTSCSVAVADGTIPEGAKVLLFLAAANRDSRHWERAETFDIRRSASGHVGFGFGIHQCLGQMVARMEAEAVLDAMIPRIAAIKLAGDPVRRLNNTLRALAHLPIEVIPA